MAIDAMRAHSEATGMPMWREAGRLVNQMAPWLGEALRRARAEAAAWGQGLARSEAGQGAAGGGVRNGEGSAPGQVWVRDGAAGGGVARAAAERIATATYLVPGALDSLDLHDAVARSAFNAGVPWFHPSYFGSGVSMPQDPVPDVHLADPLSALPLVRIVAALPTEAFVGVADGRSSARRAM